MWPRFETVLEQKREFFYSNYRGIAPEIGSKTSVFPRCAVKKCALCLLWYGAAVCRYISTSSCNGRQRVQFSRLSKPRKDKLKNLQVRQIEKREMNIRSVCQGCISWSWSSPGKFRNPIKDMSIVLCSYVKLSYFISGLMNLHVGWPRKFFQSSTALSSSSTMSWKYCWRSRRKHRINMVHLAATTRHGSISWKYWIHRFWEEKE